MKRIGFSLFIFCLLVGFAVLASAESPPTPTSAIYTIPYDDLSEIEPLLAYDLWQDRITEGSIRVRLTDEEYAQLAPQFPALTLDEVQTAYLTVDAARTFGDAGCYRTVDETEATYAMLEATYPDFVTTIDIGDSHEKVTPDDGLPGYDLFAYVLTNELANVPQPKPVYFMLATVHAREYTPSELAIRFSEHLLTNYGSDPDITWMLDYYEVHVIPQGNPDARVVVEQGTSWRKNRNTNFCGDGNFGIDLNRNVSYQWGLNGSSGNECNNLYRGPQPGSEVETIAFEEYAETILIDQRPDDLTSAAPITTTGVFLTIHSFEPSILPTWSWKDIRENPNYEQLMTFGRKMAFYNDYLVKGTDAGFFAPASGTHDDFAYGVYGVPAYTYEIGTTFSQPCADFENTIYPDNLEAVVYALKQTRQPYLTSDAPDVIDVTLAADGSLPVTQSLSVTQGAIVTLTATVDETRIHQDPFYASQNLEVVVSETITAATYTIGAPNWISGTVEHPMTAVDGTFDETTEMVQATIDTSELAYGRHTIFVTGTDATGKVGSPTAIFLDVEIPLAVGLKSAETAPPLFPILTLTFILTASAALLVRSYAPNEK